MTITTHPNDARYFASRSTARKQRRRGERIVKLGRFAGGSFGCYPRMRGNGLYVGQRVGPGGVGPIPDVTVWMVTVNRLLEELA